MYRTLLRGVLLSIMATWLLVLTRTHGVRVSVQGGYKEYKLQAIEGDRVKLICTYSAQNPNGRKRIEWIRSKTAASRGGRLIVDDKVTPHFAGNFSLQPQATLVIHSVKRSDTGYYRCTVSFPGEDPSFGTASYNLTVLVKPTKPVCAFPPGNRMTIGRRSGFTCSSSDGIPAPFYHWYKDGKQLPYHKQLSPEHYNSSFSYHPKSGVLSFKSVTSFDEGSYYCMAFNIAGKSTCSMTYVYAVVPSAGLRSMMSLLLITSLTSLATFFVADMT